MTEQKKYCKEAKGGLGIKNALILGGSGGVGTEVIKLLLKNDINILNVDKCESKIKEDNIINIINDLRKCDIDDLLKRVLNIAEKVDFFISCIGYYGINNLDDFTMQDFEKNLDINLKIPTEISVEISKHMIKNGNGKIIFVSSAAAYNGSRDISYTISKAGIIGLVKSLSRNMNGKNISIYAITPGIIDTQMSQNMSHERKMTHIDKTFQKRMCEANEVAQLIEFLLLKETSYMSGSTIHINGGLYLN